MSKLFTTVKKGKVKRSTFNLSEEVKLSCNFGQIIPILCKETLPGDSISISTELLIKFAPLMAPVMHRLKAKVDYFYIPNFQLTTVFEKFINPKLNTTANPIVLPYTTPKQLTTVWNNWKDIGGLADYFGLPVTQSSWCQNSEQPISILPFLAYQHVFNSYFRDQNAQLLKSEGATGDYQPGDPCDIDYTKDLQGMYVGSGNNFSNIFRLRNCCWKKDYFTSALPSPQAGDDVLLPITTSQQISEDGVFTFQEADEYRNVEINDNGELFFRDMNEEHQLLHYEGGLQVEGGNAGISINNLRKLFSLQKFKELAERGGTRYIEILRNFFNETAPDLYFDRPLYLGGSVQPINIGEVVQTSQTTEGAEASPQGMRAGIANSYGKTKTVHFRSRFHGYVIGVLRILPEATYQQGLERMWTRQSIYDFAWPQFANLGEQEIYNREIYANGDNNDNGIFGYTPRYSEYKTGHCHVCGQFRNNLDYWHFGRVFSNLPQLNKSFLSMDTVSYEPFHVTSPNTEHCYVNLYNTIYAKRSLPFYGTPGLL